MTKLLLLAIPVVFCVLSTSALQHREILIQPPAPMDSAQPAPEQVTLPKHIDLARLQKEADDLARTAQTIPSDVASVRHGTLPKDVLQKLKQIEKLSKHLRSELNQ